MRRGSVGRVAAVVVWASTLALGAVATPAVVMEVVGQLPEMRSGGQTHGYAVTPDGEHVAHLKRAGSRQQVVVDGREGPKYTKAGSTALQLLHWVEDPARPEVPGTLHHTNQYLVFTGNGDELVYLAEKRGQQHVVIARDGVHHEWPCLGQLHSTAISPGGEFVVAVYQEKQEREVFWRMIVNGRVSPKEAQVNPAVKAIAFHEPDGGEPLMAFIGRHRGENRVETYRVYINGVPGPAFGTVQVQNSPVRFVDYNGRPAVVYKARQSGERNDRLVVQFADGSVEQTEPGVVPQSVRFGADGTSVGWLWSPPPEPRQPRDAEVPIEVVINGQIKHAFQGKAQDANYMGQHFRVSPDGSRWAVARYVQGQGPAFWYVVVDGEESAEFGSVQRLTFSPDNQRFVFVAFNAGRQFVVEGDEEYGPFGNISPLVFSDSGQNLAWQANDDQSVAVFVNGEAVSREAASAWPMPVSFKPGTEDVVAVVAGEQGQRLMVGDEIYDAEGHNLQPPIFSDDGSRIVMFGDFYVRPGQPGSRYLVDGEPVLMDPQAVTVGGEWWTGFPPDGVHHVAFGMLNRSDTNPQNAGTLLVNGHHLGALFGYSGNDARAPHFLPDGRFRFLAVRDQEIVRFTVDLAAATSFGEAREAADRREGARELLKVGDPKLLTSFDPVAIANGDVIYGTGQGGKHGMGVVYRVNKDGSDFRVLHHFLGGGDHARNPSSLVLGADGMLYGTTGRNSFFQRQPPVAGGVFRVDPDTGDYQVLATYPHSNTFRNPPVLDAVAPGGALLGRGPVPNLERNGSPGVLRVDSSTGELSTVYRAMTYVEGEAPITRPIGPFRDGGDGHFYGFESNRLFRFSASGGEPETLHEFKGAPLDGDTARDLPVVHNGALYGFTHGGGEHRQGVLYRLQPDGSGYEILRHFDKDNKLMGLAAGDAGVWGHRLHTMRQGHRQVRVPLLERFDVAAGEPLIITDGGIAGHTWIGELDGDPMLFGTRGDVLFAMNLAVVATPQLETQTVPSPEPTPAESAEVTLVTMGIN